jgi:hypothetical protein
MNERTHEIKKKKEIFTLKNLQVSERDIHHD